MKAIAQFYTWFWIIYFPVCIAFTVVVNFDWSDEILTVLLLMYAVLKRRYLVKDKRRWKEITMYIIIMIFYLMYSLTIDVITTRGVVLDILQQVRPYVVFYLTWMLAPQFTNLQKRRIKWVMLLSFWGYLALFFIKPSLATPSGEGESAQLGQLALCCSMIYYLFSKKSKKNRNIAIFIMLLGLISGKSKYFGECICFIALVGFVKSKINYTSPVTLLKVTLLAAVVIFFTWTKFNVYYVKGFKENAEDMARPATYKTGLQIMFHDYVPFGSGLGSFATAAAAKEYSPLYFEYGLSEIWGLDPRNPMFLADAFYPTLAEYGIVGLFFFLWFWKRRLQEANCIQDIVYYRMALMCILALALESTSDSSYLSGKGMGYFMILAVCLNAGFKQVRTKRGTGILSNIDK